MRWKSSWYSKSFSTEWNWNSTVIVTSPRIGNSLESNYKFLPQRQRMLQNFASDFAPIFGGKLAQSDDTSFSLCLGRQAAHKRRELDRAEGGFQTFAHLCFSCTHIILFGSMLSQPTSVYNSRLVNISAIHRSCQILVLSWGRLINVG